MVGTEMNNKGLTFKTKSRSAYNKKEISEPRANNVSKKVKTRLRLFVRLL